MNAKLDEVIDMAKEEKNIKSQESVKRRKPRVSYKKQYEELKVEFEKLKDQLLRKAAEFENYKKRTEKEFLQLMKNANAELLTEILPIVDDFERCLQSTEKNKDFNVLLEGIQLIYKNLMKVLEKHGVQAVESVGKEFDPEKHEALMQVESKEHPPGTVVEEHLKGYIMNDRILRHAKVIVSK